MIYLHYRYAKSGLPEPATVALFTEDSDWIKTEVRSEFDVLFPESQIFLNPSHDSSAPVELAVLVYRQATSDLEDILGWGRRQLPRASLALGFYCVNQRRFEVVPARDFSRWARRQRLLTWTCRWLRCHPRLWRLFERGLRRCGFL